MGRFGREEEREFACAVPNMQFDRGYISPRPLTKIDYYGKVLVGCIKCNRWAQPGGQEASA
jgi:hypothetical protein